MLAISLKWNGQTLNRIFIETNKEYKISLAWFFRNSKELPLLDSFSDFPLGIKVVIYIFGLPTSFIQNYRKLNKTKTNIKKKTS